MEEILDYYFDAIKDSLIIFVVVLIVYILLSFVESKLAKYVENKHKYSPILGASIGLIPQCGFSIVIADLYLKEYVSVGTLIATFIACSDEAIPILLANPTKISMIIPLIIIKFVSAFFFGYLIDFIYHKHQVLKEKKNCSNLLIHKGCCNHHIEVDNHESFFKKHLYHPLIHSLKILIYVLIINISFATIIYFIGEDNISNFLKSNNYLTPLFSGLVGLIPNCASSVIISELYVKGSLSFGATMSGLICNAGLGLIYLYKNKKAIKSNLLITLILFTISLIVGYLITFIELALV